MFDCLFPRCASGCEGHTVTYSLINHHFGVQYLAVGRAINQYDYRNSALTSVTRTLSAQPRNNDN